MDKKYVIEYKFDNGQIGIIGVASSEIKADKYIHKLVHTVPRFLGQNVRTNFNIIPCIEDDSIPEGLQFSNNKSVILYYDDKYIIPNKNYSIDYKVLGKSNKRIDNIKIVASTESLSSGYTVYLSSQIPYYEQEMKPLFKEDIFGEKDGYIFLVEYNYDESLMIEEAKHIMEEEIDKK